MNNNPVQENLEGLLPIDDIIRLAKEQGVSFGIGDPRNRLRYYSNIGVLPSAKKDSLKEVITSSGRPKIVGHYPTSVVDKLVKIDRKLKEGYSIQSIKRNGEHTVPKENGDIQQPLTQESQGTTSGINIETPRAIPAIQPVNDPPDSNRFFPIRKAVITSFLILFILGSILFGGYQLKATNDSLINYVLRYTNIPSNNVSNVFYDLLSAFGGIETDGANVDLGSGELTASNVIYSLNAGDNITVSTGQTPTISAIVPDTTTGVGSVTGTVGRITVSGASDVTVNLATTYPGQTSITTLGTISTGVWNGTALADAFVGNTLTIDGTGSVTWTALTGYPATCGAGSFVRTIGDTLTCAPDVGGASTLQDVYDLSASPTTIETAAGKNILFTETTAAASSHDLLQLTGNPATGGTFSGDLLQLTLDAVDVDGFTGNGIHIIVDQSQNTGNLFLAEDDGGADLFSIDESGNIDLNSNLITNIGDTGTDFLAGGGLTLAGDLTINGGELFLTGIASSGSATEGTLYYDTDDDQLKVYANGKWQSDRTTATVIVGTSNGAGASRNYEKADFVCGATDCDTTIETAIAALPTGGGVVALLDGVYVIDSDGIDITDSNVSILGTGRGTVLQRGWDTATNDGVITVGDGGVTPVSGVTLADLAVDGVKATYPGFQNIGIHFNEAVTYSTIRNTYAHDNDGSGIHLIGSATATTNNLIEGNDVRNNDSIGILFQSSSNNTITGNNSEGNIGPGIYLQISSNNNTVVGNNSVGNSTYGINLLSSSNNTITGNNSEGNSSSGFFISGSTNNTITGNISEGNIGSGILLIGSSNNNAVTGNKIHDNGGAGAIDGIRLDTADDNLISSNDITDTAGSGQAINVLAGSDDNYLIGNRYSGTGASSIQDLGTGTTIQHRNLFEVETALDSGNIFSLDWTGATTTTAAITGLDLDLTNLTADGTNPAYGLHINDLAAVTASTEYGLFVEGTNYDYGIYSEDVVRFDANLLVGEGSAVDDDTIFFDQSNESFVWDDAPGEFDLSDDLNITGNVTTSADGSTFNGDATFNDNVDFVFASGENFIIDADNTSGVAHDVVNIDYEGWDNNTTAQHVLVLKTRDALGGVSWDDSGDSILEIVPDGVNHGGPVTDDFTAAIRINPTSITNDTVLLYNALLISSDTSGGGSVDIIDAIDATDSNITNALNLGSNSIAMTDNGEFSITDGTNNLFTFREHATNFGGFATAGAFIDKQSYFGEEFSRERADVTADTVLAWGDDTAWSVDENTACNWAVINDSLNTGTGQQTAASGSHTCLAYTGSTSAGNAHLIFDADNLPIIEMKVFPLFTASTRDFWIGIGDATAGSSSPPANGIFFTNNNGTTWTGETRSSSTSTTVTCTGKTIQAAYAYLRIEVRSTSDVRFFVDDDVSDGISEVECGSGSSANIPTVGLAGMIMNSSDGSFGHTLNLDYFRVWQDDPPVGSEGSSSVSVDPEPDLVSGADLAEYYPVDSEDGVGPGDLLSASPDESLTLTKTTKPYDPLLFGVTSTSPGLVLSGGTIDSVRLALAGRAPTKVSTENGPIDIGDPLTSSSTAGVAMKATRSGPIIGKALESFDSDGVGRIITFVSVGWYVAPLEEVADGVNQESLVTNSIILGDNSISLDQAGNIRIDGDLLVAGDIEIDGNLTLNGGLTVNKLSISSDSSGNSSLSAGQTKVFVEASDTNTHSQVLITPTILTEKTLTVTKKNEGKGFEVEIVRPESKNINFDWLVVN